MASVHGDTSNGERLLPHVIDDKAKSGYARPFAMYPRSRDIDQGFQSISYSRISNAINRACWWLESSISKEEKKENYFAYLGPNDLRYVIFLAATMKTGRQILTPSPRNTPEAQISLFEKVNCKVLVTCSSLSQNLKPLFAASRKVRKVEAPSLDDLLAEEPVPPYQFNETLKSVAKRAVITLHTSGSSGNPKPITWNHSYLYASIVRHDLPRDQGDSLTWKSFGHQNVLTLLPCFHAGGLVINIWPPNFEMTVVLGHPDVPMSAQYVSQLLKQGVATAMLSPPTFLEELSKDTSALQDLAKLKHIGYGGGPLRPDVTKVLTPVVPHLFSFIGATECGWFHCISGSNENSGAIRFYKDIGYRFDEISQGQFEMVVVSDERTNHYHGAFEVFPLLREFRTRDIYTAKSGALGWWIYRGRADDLIVLSNGEKINPIAMENMIVLNPAVKSALVVGEYRFNPSLLVELEDARIPRTEAEKVDILNAIWPTVQEANKIAPRFAKIPKSLIHFASSGKPFLRAGKGTVQRQRTVKSYAKELEYHSSSQEVELLTEGLTIRKPATIEDIEIFTKEIYSQTLELVDLRDTDDVFQRGMDSLQVTVIVQRLQAALRASGFHLDSVYVNSRLVYSFPSIEKVVGALIELMAPSESVYNKNEKSGMPLRRQNMEMLFEKYSGGIPVIKQPISGISRVQSPWNVVLTGTTGSLGSYLLAALEAMPDDKISRIYCLNRSANGKERQRKASSSRGLPSSWPEGDDQRVQFLQADFAEPSLGLRSEMYSKLLQEATVVIHCSWQVDFNLAVESFEPQIRGVRNFLDFCAKSANNTPLIFISSISTTLNWLDKHTKEKVPEGIIHDFDAPEAIGYGESKFVSELLIEKFSKVAGLTTAVFRTGQAAGPIEGKGSWNKKEWFPSIVASSKHLGVLPDNFANMEMIQWIPVDILSAVMVELVETMLQKERGEAQTLVYNLVNPKAKTWSALSSSVQKLTGIDNVVSLKTWVEALERSSHERNGAIVESNPAVKLLDFFRGLSEREGQFGSAPTYEVSGLLRDSQQASQVPAVSPSWMKLWMEQWNF